MRLSAIVGLALALALTREAHAYPQFQLVMEERCSSCHFVPSGGGLINFYGRSEAGATISRGGDGSFLHGAWEPPEWLAIGGDARFATGGKRVSGEGEWLVFPMQSDLYLRAMKGNFAISITAGLRGAAREPEPTYVERLASREHFVSYETDEMLFRAGRFYPVFGLRLPDHTAYVRRHLGMYLHEEPYAVGMSHFGEATETHVTAFVRQPITVLGAGQQPSGIAALVEHRVDDAHIYGGQLRVAVSEDEMRVLGGAIAKWRARERTLLLAELDLQRQWFLRPGAGAPRMQLAGYVGVTHWLAQGLMVTPALQIWDPDLMLKDSRRGAADVHVQYFPWAHVELHLLLRASGQGGDEDGYLALLQGHYYL